MRDKDLENFFEETAKTKKLIRDGVVNFLISSLLYSLGLFLAIRMLKSGDVISWELQWTQCTALVTGFNFIRIWDRTFMR